MAGSGVARVYAESLLEIGAEKNILDLLEEELGVMVEILASERDLGLFLRAPMVAKESKRGFVDKVFAEKFSETIVNLVKVLIENDRLLAIKEIREVLMEMIDEKMQRLRVNLTLSAQLDEGSLDKIRTVLKEKFNKDIILDLKIDNSILGGIIIRIGDMVIDGSLAKDLRNLRNNLLKSKIRGVAAYED